MCDNNNRIGTRIPANPHQYPALDNNAVPAPAVASTNGANRLTKVPSHIVDQMKYLEKPKNTSKGWRIVKNIGFGALGAGTALALASNPVGWAVGVVLTVGACMAAYGTYKTIRADIARTDVKAYQQSLQSGGPIQERASNWKRGSIVLGNLAGGAAYAAAGFFGGAAIGAAFHSTAFTSFSAQQSASFTAFGQSFTNKAMLPVLYGVSGTIGFAPGWLYDRYRTRHQVKQADLTQQLDQINANQTVPNRVNFAKYQHQRLATYNGTRALGVPTSAASERYYRKETKIAKGTWGERGRVQAQGMIAAHYQQTNQQAQALANAAQQNQNLAQQPQITQIAARDHEIIWQLGHQNGQDNNKRVQSYDYARIPVNNALFADGPPKVEDLRQGHQRANCFMTAAIASALIRPGGARKIQEIMQDNNNGTVTVRLRGADVTVDKSRIVTADEGYDCFNMGPDWAHILEKAMSAYFLRNSSDVDMGFSDQGMRLLSHLLGDADASAVDLNNMSEDGAALSGNDYVDDGRLAAIDQQMQNNGAALLQISNQPERYDTRLQQRLIPGHFYSVLGNARRGGKDGYLLFDAHGTSVGWDGQRVGSMPKVKSNNGNQIEFDQGRRGSNGIFFVSRREAKELFDGVWTMNAQRPPPQRDQLQQTT